MHAAVSAFDLGNSTCTAKSEQMPLEGAGWELAAAAAAIASCYATVTIAVMAGGSSE